MADTEKITINMSVVDLGKIDLLVDEGFYSNRTDFIRTAVRVQLDRHDEEVKQTVTRRALVIGALNFTRSGLEKRRAAGETVDAWVVGTISIADDVPPELAADTINSIKVYGTLKANKAIKKALADRIK